MDISNEIFTYTPVDSQQAITRYPWARMWVGDCFKVEYSPIKNRKLRHAIRGMRFSVSSRHKLFEMVRRGEWLVITRTL